MRPTASLADLPVAELTAEERHAEITRLTQEQRDDDTSSITQQRESFGEFHERPLSLEAFSSAKLVDFLIGDGRVETYKPVDGDAEASLGDRLVAAIADLSPESREIINGLFWERLTERGLATRLGVTREAVRWRKNKAITELRLLLTTSASETATAV